MGSIPDSTLPGHKGVHDRALAALSRCAESQSVEFKRSISWEEIRIQLVRAAMAMSNLRDGGLVIIGVSEADDAWRLTGIEDQHLKTYSSDDIHDYVNKYTNVALSIDVVIVEHNGKRFLALQVSEFDEVPVICRQNSADNGRSFCAGDLFIRPRGKPQSIKIQDVETTGELLNLAAEKIARRLISQGTRIGLAPSPTAKQQFDDELGGISPVTSSLPTPITDGPHWRVLIRPDSYNPALIQDLQSGLEIVAKNKVSMRGLDYPSLSDRTNEVDIGNNWVGCHFEFMDHREAWRLYQSGQFIHLFNVRERTSESWHQSLKEEARSQFRHLEHTGIEGAAGFINFVNLIYCVTEIVEFATRLAQSQLYTRQLDLTIELKGIRGFILIGPKLRSLHLCRPATLDAIGNSWTVGVAEIVANNTDLIVTIAIWIFQRFGWLSPSPKVIESDIQSLRQRRIY